jgi:hypothetical protein
MNVHVPHVKLFEILESLQDEKDGSIFNIVSWVFKFYGGNFWPQKIAFKMATSVW